MLLRVKERSREFFCFSLSEKRHFKAKKPPDKVNDYGDKVNDCRTKCNRRWAAAADAVTNGRPAVVAAGQFNRSLSA